MSATGECPTCSRVIVESAKVPWHFKLLVGSAVAYLGWRAVQGVGWIADRLS